MKKSTSPSERKRKGCIVLVGQPEETSTLPPMASLARRCFANRCDDRALLADVVDGALALGACAELQQWEKQILELISSNFPRACNNESVYTGGPGVAYALLRVARLGGSGSTAALELAQRFLEPWTGRVAQQAKKYPDLGCSLLCGQAGFLLVAALSARARNANPKPAMQEYVALAHTAAQAQCLESDEWLYGRAGYLHGCLVLQAIEDTPELRRCIQEIAEVMLQRGVSYARQLRSSKPPPVMWEWYRDRYMGAAHGVMGIIFMLLHVPSMREGPNLETLRKALHWLGSMRQSTGNWPVVFGEGGGDCIHFCHGATGAVLLFCKAYEVLKEDQWLAMAKDAGEVVWKYGLLKKGPGICHGIAGNGYSFLTLYRVTEDVKWLGRAHHFARQMFSEEVQKQSRTPDNPFSLFEGLAGTLCFLMDLRLRPKAAAFPLFELETSTESGRKRPAEDE
eukprot:s443_g45.t1